MFTLCFEVDCKLYLLIPIVTVAYTHFTMHMFSIHLLLPSHAAVAWGNQPVTEGRYANLGWQFIYQAPRRDICHRYIERLKLMSIIVDFWLLCESYHVAC